MQQLLNLSVIDSPLLYAFYALSVLAALFLVLRAGLRPRPGWRKWLATAAAAFVGGALAGAAVLFVSEVVLNVFGLPLDADTRIWVIGAFAGVGLAAVNLWRSRWWRKAVAVLACLVFVATAALGVNAGYGLNPTLGALLGVSQIKHLALPKLFRPHKPETGSALWQH
jgi:hypothetical protein